MPDFSNMNELEDLDSKVKYNYYDLSENNLCNGEIGALMPLWCRKALPGDKIEIADTIFAMSTNPLVSRPMERVKIFTHYYYMESRKMWKGFKNYIDKGLDGQQTLTLPKISDSFARVIGFDGEEYLDSLITLLDGPMSLRAYLDHAKYYNVPTNENPLALIKPWVTGIATATDEGIKGVDGYGLNALPFFMYQSIYKWYYLNWNLIRNNRHWLPLNEDDWIIPYDGFTWEGQSGGRLTDCYIDKFDDTEGTQHDITFYSPAPTNEATEIQTGVKLFDTPSLLGMRYRQWRQDDYTGALPWLERSNLTPQVLNAVFTAGQIPGSMDSLNEWANAHNVQDIMMSKNGYVQKSTFNDRDGYMRSIRVNGDGKANSLYTNSEEELEWNSGYMYTAQTMQQIRNLAIMDSFVQQSAQCDGSYNDFIKSFYDYDPKAEDLKPVYIGGTEQDIIFSEVLQTSADGATPLGTQAGRAVSAGSGYVGKFTAPDHGYFMCIASIVPDTRYAQGRDPEMKGGITGLEEYNPKLSGLGPEEINDSELYANNDNENNSLFGYRKRFGNYMHGKNKVHNMLAIPPGTNIGENYYTSMSFARFFNEIPKLNNDFVTMTPANVRRDMFSVPSQPMFTINYTIKCDAYRKIPKEPQSASLTNII